MRILIADDEPGFVELVSRHVHGWGHEAIAAPSGVEAWRKLRREDAPPLAILDWAMSDLSGLEVCRMLRSTPHGAGVYVILSMRRGERVDLVEAREAGVDDVIVKPILPRELHFRIARGFAFREGRPRPRAQSIPPPGAAPSSIPPSLTPQSFPPVSSAAAAAAVTLAGRYRLDRILAEGTAATVWLGLHLSLGVSVAVRFMKAVYAADVDYVDFERDARAAAQLRSENISRVYGHGSHEGLPYLVMEYLGGETLAARVARKGPLSLDAVVSLVDQIARGLDEAHGQGIVHRDVRPENVVLIEDTDRPEGFVAKLVDFGFVKAALTTVATTGRGEYMSPEFLEGRSEPSPALDSWGLAATAFFAATGHPPFGGFAGASAEQVRARVCVEPPPVPSDINPALGAWFDTWFARACARSPAARYGGAAELAAALLSMRRGRPAQ